MQLFKSVIRSIVADKLRDIKETTSGAAEIIKESGSPELHKSLDKIKETALTALEYFGQFAKTRNGKKY